MRSEAEAQIYELLNVKIDELLDLENFDWNKSQIQGQASEYMKSLLSFLKGTLETFNHLPVSCFLHYFGQTFKENTIVAIKFKRFNVKARVNSPILSAIFFPTFSFFWVFAVKIQNFKNTILHNFSKR